MQVSDLLAAGFRWVGEPPRVYQNRPKVSGYMWASRGVMQRGETRLFWEMWYHGGDLPPSLDEGMTLKGVEVAGRYYDTYWYAFITASEIWIHPGGWFQWSEARRRAFWDDLGGHPNYNWQVSPDYPHSFLQQKGFMPVVTA